MSRDKHAKTNKKKKRILIAMLIIFIIILIILGFGIGFILDKLGKLNQVNLDVNKLGLDDKVEQNLSEYRNIALFGIDSRSDDYGKDSGKGYRSDCIIIASINNKTKEVKLVSVYRDSYLKIDGYGLDKAAHAYAYGGPELAINMLNTNLDLNISEFVTVNWSAVAEAIDELGGVTINIESYEISEVNKVIEETAVVVKKSDAKITKAGSQTLNGVQAVSYARTRSTEGGDYKRTERMRNVIMAMVSKLKSKNIGEMNSLADSILPKIKTNIAPTSILAEIPSFLNYKIVDSLGWPYKIQGITLNIWYGVPVTLKSNVEKLHKEIFNEQDYIASDKIEEINKAIINKTGYSK